MEQSSFDRIARALGGAVDRRAGLKAALAATFGLAVSDAAARPARGGKGKGDGKARKDGKRPNASGPCGDGSIKANSCQEDGDCCTEICQRKRNGKKGAGRCRCVNEGRPCDKDVNCCSRGGQALTCASGRCRGAKIATGEPCSAGDICASKNATCTEYASGTPTGTYCLLSAGSPCAANGDCVSGNCANGTCNAKAPNGGACKSTADCASSTASCTGYTLGADSPAGNFCLLPAGQTCDADDDCASGFCTGVCEPCTVCKGGNCPYTSIKEANAAGMPPGTTIGIAPGAYSEGFEVTGSYIFRRCGSHGTVNWTQTPTSIYTKDEGVVWFDDGDLNVTLKDLVMSSDGTVSMAVVYIDGGTVTMINVIVEDYDGEGNPGNYGGVVMGDSCGVLTMIGCTIRNNKAPGAGGGLYCSDSKVTLVDTVITGNSSTEFGGGIYMSGCSGTFSNVTLTSNTAVKAGGAYYGTIEDYAFFDNSTITGNSVTSTTVTQTEGIGGAFFLDGNLQFEVLTLAGSTVVSGNSAANGGGIATSTSDGTATITVGGASGRVTNNTGGDQCIRSDDSGLTWTAVPGCAY